MNKAVFLDRDGVINKMIFNEQKKEFQPPFRKDDLQIYEGVIESLRALQENGFKIFLISNQPDYAKGNTGLENLSEVQNELNDLLVRNNIYFSEYYYCYHHPEGVIKEYSFDCECRKPKNYFVLKAIKEYDLDKGNSWFVGDRDKDVECGKRSGMKTIRVESSYYQYIAEEDADYVAADLREAVKIILSKNKN